MTTLADLGIPFLSQNQSQPEATLNESLIMLAMLQLGVISVGDNAPPAGSSSDPLEAGDCYIVGGSPTGAWAGHANAFAYYTGSAWRFVPGLDDAGSQIAMGTRHAGLHTWNRAASVPYVWDGSAWVVMTDGSGA